VQRTPAITVLTPTYNRALTLPRLYDSLAAQTFRDFEWLVVDDGSEDETEALVSRWSEEGKIAIRYAKQANAGKHVAVNRGVELARGAYTTIVDSDDWLVPNALERLLHHWHQIPEDERAAFSGVVGLCAYEDGTVIGDPYPADPLDCDQAQIVYQYGVTGDKHSLLRTEALREFPFPFEEVRGWVVEALVWNRMALMYRERHVNEVVMIKEYQRGGISDRGLELQIRAAVSTRQFYLEELLLPHRLRWKRRLRSNVNYVRFSFHAGIGLSEQAAAAPSKLTWLASLPVGFAVHRRDARRLAKG
jgi:glycosyltransferase involved in cell wall biosynthesis